MTKKIKLIEFLNNKIGQKIYQYNFFNKIFRKLSGLILNFYELFIGFFRAGLHGGLADQEVASCSSDLGSNPSANGKTNTRSTRA